MEQINGTLAEISKRGITFHGACHAVIVVERQDSASPLIELWVEDDELYHLKHSFDAHWLPGLMDIFKNAESTAQERVVDEVKTAFKHSFNKPERQGLRQDPGREALTRVQALEARVAYLETRDKGSSFPRNF